MISQQELKERLHYNPKDGAFTWKISSCNRAKVGDVAGHVTPTRYITIRINKKSYLAHRLAWFYMKGEWPKNQIDHDNHIRNDNRWLNLFEATQQENSKNQSKSKNNTSGITGVYWEKRRKKWQANIMISGKLKHLIYSDDKFEVICARKSAERKHDFHINHGAQRVI